MIAPRNAVVAFRWPTVRAAAPNEAVVAMAMFVVSSTRWITLRR